MSKNTKQIVDPGSVSYSVNTKVAAEISMLAGAIYSSIHYHTGHNRAIENNKVYFERKYWMYHSVRAIQENYYSFATKRQILSAISKLKKAGYIAEMKDKSVRNNTSLYSILK